MRVVAVVDEGVLGTSLFGHHDVPCSAAAADTLAHVASLGPAESEHIQKQNHRDRTW